jgi:hypothetical protein
VSIVRIAIDVLAVVGGLTILALLSVALRRRFIQRGASFDCSLRLREKRFGQGWVLGVARYADDRLEWYRVFSTSVRPKRVLPRAVLQIGGRRDPAYPETLAIMPGHVIVECTVGGSPVEVAMSAEALTGFVAWRESAPPGRHLGAA